MCISVKYIIYVSNLGGCTILKIYPGNVHWTISLISLLYSLLIIGLSTPNSSYNKFVKELVTVFKSFNRSSWAKNVNILLKKQG